MCEGRTRRLRELNLLVRSAVRRIAPEADALAQEWVSCPCWNGAGVEESAMRRLIIGMTGSTGAIFGVRMLEALKGSDIESHLIISKWAQRTLEHETHYTVEQVRSLASVVHSPGDMGASISSGSFKTDGMAVMPCSVRTLAGIANGYGEHLVHRAADVVLKERRRLVLLVRETPLSEVHLENMLKLARMGVSIVPPMPAFYNHPQTVDDLVSHIVARVLDQFDIPAPFARRWDGHMHTATRIASVQPGAAPAKSRS
jgi:4-hydroxy-3-polyprenylbenzoate decarboxylase